MNNKKKPLHICLPLLLAATIIFISAGCVHDETNTVKETVTATAAREEDHSEECYEMVERAKARFDLDDIDVLSAMERIPRHLFVPEDVRDLAYFDTPLPIGFGQTISAPYMAAFFVVLCHFTRIWRYVKFQ